MKTFIYTVLFAILSNTVIAGTIAIPTEVGARIVRSNTPYPKDAAYPVPLAIREGWDAGTYTEDDLKVVDKVVSVKSRQERINKIRAEKKAAITAKSATLMILTFDEKQFSTARDVQVYWVGIATLDAKGLIPWPFTVTALDDTGYTFADSNAYTLFLGSVMQRVNYVETGERELLEACDACTTPEELDAVVDNRQ